MMKTIGVIAFTALLVTAGTLATTEPADAGTNGQHLQTCTRRRDIASARAWGTDYKGDFAETDTRPLQSVTAGRCAAFGDYWFKGNLTVRWYFSNGTTAEGHFYVPISKPDNNWWTAWYEAQG
ncbi:hypothetical protein ACIA49_33185 [Kribbella sp. NPDC051587]|uniref:hypothetical protein n=1 Tax=Kribbella sp. NPDC051587 TaxID=3364119 RepID=UPI0037B06645